VAKLAVEMRINAAKTSNASKTSDEPLVPVPLPNGELPRNDYPTIAELIVSGNEKLPCGVSNDWNAQKSLKLIREYDPTYETDDETASDVTSRRRRLKLAQHLGLTPAQLNTAMTAIYFC